MCGSTGAFELLDDAGPLAAALGVVAVLDAALEEDLHAHADAEHRAAAGQPAADDPGPVDGAQPGHAGGEGADAGDDEAVGVEGGLRGRRSPSTSAPTRASARSAERRLPDP